MMSFKEYKLVKKAEAKSRTSLSMNLRDAYRAVYGYDFQLDKIPNDLTVGEMQNDLEKEEKNNGIYAISQEFHEKYNFGALDTAVKDNLIYLAER